MRGEYTARGYDQRFAKGHGGVLALTDLECHDRIVVGNARLYRCRQMAARLIRVHGLSLTKTSSKHHRSHHGHYRGACVLDGARLRSDLTLSRASSGVTMPHSAAIATSAIMPHCFGV